jgi:2-haloacid dehalogenase
MRRIKVLAFDTGGTILDWHGGLTGALTDWGTAQGDERDWHELANEYRRQSLRGTLNAVEPPFNIDDVHRDVLNRLLDANGLGGSPAARRAIAAQCHELDAWPDFAPALTALDSEEEGGSTEGSRPTPGVVSWPMLQVAE